MTLFLLLLFAVILAGGWDILSAVKAEGSPNDYPSELRIKAKQGDADAQFNLGAMYLNGEGVPQDYAEAAPWLRKAADQGDADAQFNLGYMYANGQGMKKNKKTAFDLYRKAAEQGQPLAQFNLGLSYYHGEGVPQNFKTAYIWSSLSAANADEDHHKKAAELRDEVAKKLSPAQLEQAKQIASEWKPKNQNGE